MSVLTEVIKNAPAFVREFEWDVDTIRYLAYDGVDSGVFMSTVTYHEAKEFMAEWGDEVIEWLYESYGEALNVSKVESWSYLAVYFMSLAFETWAVSVLSQLEDED